MNSQRKTCEIRKVQWTGDNMDEVRAFFGQFVNWRIMPDGNLQINRFGKFNPVAKGDWICEMFRSRGAGFYSMSPDQFYELPVKPVSA